MLYSGQNTQLYPLPFSFCLNIAYFSLLNVRLSGTEIKKRINKNIFFQTDFYIYKLKFMKKIGRVFLNIVYFS